MPEENKQLTLGSNLFPLNSQPDTLPMRRTHTWEMSYFMKSCTYFLSNFTTSELNIRIIKSKAKIVKFNVNLLFIKRDDFLRTYMNNCTSYTEHAGEE